MQIDFDKLDFTFTHKPLLIGGKAMEYYQLRPAGDDIDCVIVADDFRRFSTQYPELVKELRGDFAVARFEFELWGSITIPVVILRGYGRRRFLQVSVL